MSPESGRNVKQTVYTIEECLKCGLKNKRLFTQGDYVIKEAGKCPRCGATLTISAIYAETPPKA
jgi:rRNA maturation protein Nop10